MQIQQASREQLENWHKELRAQYADYQQRKLSLDLTRGKPSAEQLALSDALDGNLHSNYTLDNTDLRNYGGLEGLPSARKLGAALLGLDLTRNEWTVNLQATVSHRHGAPDSLPRETGWEASAALLKD